MSSGRCDEASLGKLDRMMADGSSVTGWLDPLHVLRSLWRKDRSPDVETGQQAQVAIRRNMHIPVLLKKHKTGHYVRLTRLCYWLAKRQNTVGFPDLATCTFHEVALLPGMGDKTAQAFIDWRDSIET